MAGLVEYAQGVRVCGWGRKCSLTMGLTTGACMGDCRVTAKHRRGTLSQGNGHLSLSMRQPARATHLSWLMGVMTMVTARMLCTHGSVVERMVVMVVVGVARHLANSTGAWQVVVGKHQDVHRVLVVW